MRAVITCLFVLSCLELPANACWWSYFGCYPATTLWYNPSSIAYATDSTAFIVDNLLFKSTDGGATWSMDTTAPWLNTRFEWVTFASATVGFVGPLTSSSYLRTTDGGNTWEERATDFNFVGQLYAPDSLHIYFVGQDSRIYSSADGGQTWTQSTTSFQGYYLRAAFFLDPSNAWLVADWGYYERRVYRSLDGGQNWSLLCEIPPDYYDCELKFRNASIGYVNNPWQLLRTADSGHTWQSVYTGHVHQISIVSDVQIYAVHSGDTIIQSDDQGTTWTEVVVDEVAANHFSSIQLMAFKGPSNGLIPFRAGGLLRTDDGGQSWTATVNRMYPHVIQASVSGISYWFIDDSSRARSSIGGNSPTRMYQFPIEHGLHDICAINDSSAIIASDSGIIYRTQEYGLSWSRVSTPVLSRLYSVSYFANEDVAFACGDSGVILRSADRGLTWEAVQTNTTETLKFIGESSTFDSMCVGYNGTVLRCQDDGYTWSSVVTPTNEDLLGFHVYDGKLAVYGTNGAFLVSSDNGESWTDSSYSDGDVIEFKTGSGPFNPRLVLFADGRYACGRSIGGPETSGFVDLLAMSDHFLAICDSCFSTVMWYDHFNMAADEPTLPDDFTFSVYPNPFNSTATIEFELPQNAVTRIAVYDVLGRVAKEVTNQKFTAGTHTLSLDASDLASGVYFVNIATPQISTTQKLLLLR